MSQDRNGHTTAENKSPNRRSALSLFAGFAGAVGLSASYASAEPAPSEIAVLFAQWKPLIAKLDVWEQEMNAACERAYATYPDVPAQLRFENAPEWHAYLSHFLCTEIDREGVEFKRITQDGLQRLIDHAARSEPGPWAREALQIANKYAADKDAVEVAAGIPELDAAWSQLNRAISDFENRIMVLNAQSLADTQMQIRIVQSRHELETVGPFEERLFESILSIDASNEWEA
jgi:hypothetical protein